MPFGKPEHAVESKRLTSSKCGAEKLVIRHEKCEEGENLAYLQLV